MSSGKPLNWNEWLWGKWRQHLLKQLFYHQLPISWDASMSGHGTPSKDATMNSFALESLQVCFVQKDNLPISINGCISWRNDIIFFSLLKAVDLINTPGKLSIMMHLFWENTTLRNQCFVDPLYAQKEYGFLLQKITFAHKQLHYWHLFHSFFKLFPQKDFNTQAIQSCCCLDQL